MTALWVVLGVVGSGALMGLTAVLTRTLGEQLGRCRTGVTTWFSWAVPLAVVLFPVALPFVLVWLIFTP